MAEIPSPARPMDEPADDKQVLQSSDEKTFMVIISISISFHVVGAQCVAAASACGGVVVRRTATTWECNFVLQSYVTKYYKVLQKYQMLLQIVAMCYKTDKCC